MRKFWLMGAVASLSLAAASAQATEVVSNGDFETGDLTGWTVYTTTNGIVGVAPAPRVTSFDVTGSGASDAAQLQVGQFNFGGPNAGGGIRQTITTVAGALVFSAKFAAQATSASNADAGLFEVLLDGVSLNSFNLGSINNGDTMRGSLAFNTTVTAGDHVLALQATRHFITADPFGRTPFQYFDDVSATQAGGSTAPEPATWALMIAGFGLTGGALRRRGASTAQA